jgi:hypothetical protein
MALSFCFSTRITGLARVKAREALKKASLLFLSLFMPLLFCCCKHTNELLYKQKNSSHFHAFCQNDAFETTTIQLSIVVGVAAALLELLGNMGGAHCVPWTVLGTVHLSTYSLFQHQPSLPHLQMRRPKNIHQVQDRTGP